MRSFFLALTLSLGLSVAPSLDAQMPDWARENGARSNTRGLHLGASLNGSAQQVDGADTESGGGIGLRLGYGFSPLVTLYIASEGAWFSEHEYALGHGDLGLRFNFASADNKLRPYLDVAASGRAMQDEIYQISGFGGTLGGGLQYFLSTPLALDLGLKWTFGSYTTVKERDSGTSVSADDGIDASSARFNIGLSWYPMVRR